MMNRVVHHLASRALGWSRASQWQPELPPGTERVESLNDYVERIPAWGMALLCATVLLYVIATTAISYTYGTVIATLAIIESPPEKSPEKETLLEDELAMTRQPPITGSLRRSIHHLGAEAGPLARFRGFAIFTSYNLFHNSLTDIFSGSKFGGIRRSIVSVAITVLMCNLHAVWNHRVISRPTQQRWWQNRLSLEDCRVLLMPTAVWAVAKQVSEYVPYTLFGLIDWTALEDKRIALLALVGIIALFIGTVIVIVIPAHVTLIRLEASLLPADQQTIVPFDRTFNGMKAENAELSILAAWKSFDRSSRLRLLRVYGKVFAIQLAVAVFFLLDLALELKLILGSDFCGMMRHVSQSVREL